MQFSKADGSGLLVDSLRLGDELQGPEINAVVGTIMPHATMWKPTVVLSVTFKSGNIETKVSHDHPMFLQNPVYRRTSDLQIGDFVFTSEDDLPVAGIAVLDEWTPN